MSVKIHSNTSRMKKLHQLEGIVPINAANLYISIGCAELGAFSKGKDASA
jgi:hypothetical protein